MKQKLLWATLFVAGALGVSTAQAYGGSDLITAGWTKITSISQDDISDNYYVFMAKGLDLMVGQAASSVQSNRAAFFQTAVNPTTDLSKVWYIEANGTNYAMRNMEYCYLQMQTEWSSSSSDLRWRTNDQPSAVTWTGLGLSYSSEDEAWTLTSTQYSRPLGIYNNGTGTPADGTEIGANDTGNGQLFEIYAIAKSKFFAQYVSEATTDDPTEVTSFIFNADFNNSTKTQALGWTYPTKTSGNFNFNGAIEQWHYNPAFDFNQTLSFLSNGKYKLTAQVSGATSAYIYAGDEKTYATTTAATSFASEQSAMAADASYHLLSVEATVVGGSLTIGIADPSSASTWLVFDNFKLYYYPIDLSEYVTALATAVSNAEALSGQIPTAAYAALNNVVTENNNTYDTADDYTTAISNINTAITTYSALVSPYSNYQTWKTNIQSIEAQNVYTGDEAKTTLESSISTADTNVETATTEDEIQTQTNALISAFQTFVTSVTMNDDSYFDFTALITNNSFETGDGTGWTYNTANDTGVKANSNGTYTVNNCDGAYLFNTWGGTSEKYIKQTLTNLPAGSYSVSALIASDAGISVTLYAGTASTSVAASSDGNKVGVTGTAGYATVKESGGSLEIGATSTDWYKVDNFTLSYTSDAYNSYAKALTAAQAVDQDSPMNADVLTALQTALNNNGSLTSESEADDLLTAATALNTATANATTSITSYTTAASVLPQMKALTESTNVYTESAYNTYYKDYQDKYDARTLTDTEASALENPYTVRDWHAANTVDDLLLSEWTIGGTACSNYDTSLYINTWSIEGASDGTNFVVPFFEYWIGDAYSLGATTLQATHTGLEAGHSYAVSAWVRVRQTNDQTKADNSITLQVGSGTAVDVTQGTQIGTSQFYHDTFTAYGTADEDGKLTITFTVAENSNISWLSFQNVKISSNEETVEVTSAGYATLYYGEKNLIVPEDVTAYTYKVEDNKLTVSKTYETGEVIPAATGVVIKTGSGTHYFIVSTETGEADEDNQLRGSDTEEETTGGAPYYALSLNASGDDDSVGFYWMAENGAAFTNGAHKAYLALNSTEEVKSGYTFKDGEAVSIQSIGTADSTEDGPTYNLAGQQVDKSYKGIVIKNGKKYLNK